MNIGERIKKRREELGISQEELALKLGYKNRSSINKIEQNKQNLRQSKIKDIADALSTTPSYIMGWDDIKNIHQKQEDIYSQIRELGKIPHQDYSEEEKKLVEEFRNLSEEAQRQLVLMLAFFKDQNNKK